MKSKPDAMPRTVSGYRSPVPVSSPSLLPGATALLAAKRLAVHAAVGVAAALLVLALSGPVWIVGPLSIVGFFLLFRGWGKVGDRNLEELAAGYTTLTFQLGDYWVGGNKRYRNNGFPWDYRGAWVLDGAGNVRSAPDRAFDPPGLFSSPGNPGVLEVWTGVVWTGHVRTVRQFGL